MNILIRLPNWLGDMVMSTYFVRAVQAVYPEARVSVIVKKGLEGLLDFFPPLHQRYIFNKAEYPGIRGAFRFGRCIRAEQSFELFFCLPDSFSSAWMGWATGAKERIGYRKEGRNFLLTRSFRRDMSPHRVIQYLQLLERHSGKTLSHVADLQLAIPQAHRSGIVVNIHSEASSRRLPEAKAVEMLTRLLAATDEQVILIGGPKDIAFTHRVAETVGHADRLTNLAGKTSLPQLVDLFRQSRVLLSSDSGPAHLANASGLPVVVLFGAGNENETGPFYQAPSQVLRLGKLSCEPCRKNECRFGIAPPCLTDLNTAQVIAAVLKLAAS